MYMRRFACNAFMKTSVFAECVTSRGGEPEDRLHEPFARYVKLRIAHAPGMPGTFSPATDFKGNR